jgi:hypothetical protein
MKSFLKKVGSNRRFRAQTLTVIFKNPFDSLAKTTVAAQLAASEDERNSIWWGYLTFNRTALKENPVL